MAKMSILLPKSPIWVNFRGKMKFLASAKFFVGSLQLFSQNLVGNYAVLVKELQLPAPCFSTHSVACHLCCQLISLKK